MMKIIQDKLDTKKLKNTIVERKGLGHPDTLADGIAEAISIEYSKYCLKNFGAILHHNLDKTLIRGGLFEANFGSGKMIVPITLSINGRYSQSFKNKIIPFKRIARQAAIKYLSKVLPNFKEDYLEIKDNATSFSHSKYWFNPKTLKDVPDRKSPHSNDTSMTYGYWPINKNEQIALTLEESLYYQVGKPIFKNMGQDIKTMVCPVGNSFRIIMCIPLISKLTKSPNHYRQTITKIKAYLEKIIRNKFKVNKFELEINTADKNIKHEKFYLLHTGSCLEGGEEGAVGRGSGILGIVSSDRPHSAEAIAGKNPQYHVGKVYSFFAQKIAYQLANKHNCHCEVKIVSQNGNSLFKPSSIIISSDKKISNKEIRKIISQVISKDKYRQQILTGAMLPVAGGEHLDKLSQTVFSR